MGGLTTPLEQGGAGLTAEDALDVLFFEQDTLDLVEQIVLREKLDVDFWRGHRLDGESYTLPSIRSSTSFILC